MARRGENIHYRSSDGRWEARVKTGPPIGGRTQYKYLYGRSYSEVKEKKRRFLLDFHKGDAPARTSGRISFKEAAERWLLSKEPAVKKSTFLQYGAVVRIYLSPRFGKMPLDELTTGRLTDFIAHLRKSVSPKTARDVRCILLSILSRAARDGYLSRVPDCPLVPNRPAAPAALTRSEQERLSRAAMEDGTPFSLGVLLALYGSLRNGEACGVRWGDIDPSNGTVGVGRTVMRIADPGGPARTKVVIARPKTDCSARTVPLPEPVFAYLMERRGDDGCYITTGTDEFMEPRSCRNRFNALLDRAGLPHFPFHALRHTYATRCVEAGIDVKSLSEMMGHSDVRTTMQLYVHPSMDSKREQVGKLPVFGF